MFKYLHLLSVCLVLAIALVIGSVVSEIRADDDDDDKKTIVEFDEAEIFFEFNSSDLDLGIQLFFDATGWKRVRVKGPNGQIFKVKNGRGLKDIGSTEVFTESAEPPLDEENLEEEMDAFLAKFPEGEYMFKGKTIEGHILLGSAELSHDLPVPVSLDLEDFPIIHWTDESEAGDPEIVGYEVVVEMVVEIDDDEEVFVNTATLPASETSFTASEEFATLAEQYEDDDVLVELKVEVIAREESGNKTITEEALIEEEE